MAFSVVPFGVLSENDRALLEAAQGVRLNAYAPYSNYYVGSAVRALDGGVYTAANVENASYGLSLCAEACALAAANAAGNFKIEAVAVIGGPAEPQPDHLPGRHVAPCGRCRQMLAEASQAAGTDVVIICGVEGRDDVLVGTISDFLPEAFGPADLGLTKVPFHSGLKARKATG